MKRGGAASEPKHCRDAMNEVLCKARAMAFLLIQVLNEMNAFDLFPFHTLHTLM